MRHLYAAILVGVFLGAVVVLGGCGGSTPPPAPPAPASSDTEQAPSADMTSAGGSTTTEQAASSDSTAPAPAGRVTYKLTPETAVIWAATVPLGTRKGGWTDFTGTIDVENGDFSTAVVSVEVQMKSVFADAAEIKEKMLGDEHFFAPGKFPTSKFKSTSVKKTDTGYDVTAELTIRDKTKTVVFPVTNLKMDAKSLTCSSKVKLNRHDFDVEYNSAIGDYVIEDMCDLMLDVVAEPE